MKRKAIETHHSEVQQLATIVRQGSRLNLEPSTHASNTTHSPAYKRGGQLVPLNDLDGILAIDTNAQLADVEPRVSFDRLVQATLRLGLVPAVVPEFRGITVGGAISGAALESSSHRFGGFHDACDSFEVILGTGEVTTLSPTSRPELFHALPGSYGTLGLITSARVKLIPAQTSVAVRYYPTGSIETTIERLKTQLSHTPYIEAIQYSLEAGVVIEAFPTPRKATASLRPSWSEWFYQRAYQLRGGEERLPFGDYLFRTDRAAFWMAQYLLSPAHAWAFWRQRSPPKKRLALPLYPPFWFRLLFGRWLSSQRLYRLLHRGHEAQVGAGSTIQDCVIPWHQATQFLEAAMGVDIWPIWLCPIRRTQQTQLFSPHSLSCSDETVLDVGIYGLPQDGRSGWDATRWLEQLTQQAGGRKGLYSLNTYDPTTFWSIYDQPTYHALREQTGAQGRFPSIEEKVLSPASR